MVGNGVEVGGSVGLGSEINVGGGAVVTTFTMAGGVATGVVGPDCSQANSAIASERLTTKEPTIERNSERVVGESEVFADERAILEKIARVGI